MKNNINYETLAECLNKFSEDGIENLESARNLNPTQALSLLIGFCSVKGAERGRTYVLVYTDPGTGVSNFQTAGTPYDATNVSPFSIDHKDGSTEAVIRGVGTGRELPVKVHANIGSTTNHHYSRVDPDLNELPTALIVSPRSTCAAGCRGCSRGATKAFSKPDDNYIEKHVRQIAEEYYERGFDKSELASVSITTGSHATEKKEVEMLTEIMDVYRKFGFDNAKFMIYNHILRSREAMQAILDAGAIGYIGTIETMNDELRCIHWGDVKGGQTFEDHLRRYELAKDVGFKIVETNYVVGVDPYEEMMRGIVKLDNEGVAVVPNIMRSYNTSQFQTIHPDVFDVGASYIFNAFDVCIDSYRHPTIKKYAGKKSVDYLHRRGLWPQLTHYLQLPIRHT